MTPLGTGVLGSTMTRASTINFFLKPQSTRHTKQHPKSARRQPDASDARRRGPVRHRPQDAAGSGAPSPPLPRPLPSPGTAGPGSHSPPRLPALPRGASFRRGRAAMGELSLGGWLWAAAAPGRWRSRRLAEAALEHSTKGPRGDERAAAPPAGDGAAAAGGGGGASPPATAPRPSPGGAAPCPALTGPEPPPCPAQRCLYPARRAPAALVGVATVARAGELRWTRWRWGASSIPGLSRGEFAGSAPPAAPAGKGRACGQRGESGPVSALRSGGMRTLGPRHSGAKA